MIISETCVSCGNELEDGNDGPLCYECQELDMQMRRLNRARVRRHRERKKGVIA